MLDWLGRIILGRIHMQSNLKKKELNNLKKKLRRTTEQQYRFSVSISRYTWRQTSGFSTSVFSSLVILIIKENHDFPPLENKHKTKHEKTLTYWKKIGETLVSVL